MPSNVFREYIEMGLINFTEMMGIFEAYEKSDFFDLQIRILQHVLRTIHPAFA